MKMHRPEGNPRNGCSLIAIAALIGGDPRSYEKYAENPTRGRYANKFAGMTTLEQQAAFRAQGITTTLQYPKRRRLRMDNYLPLNGRGIVAVQHRGHYHAIAFDGKMVYDNRTGGRWMWVYDHPWARTSVRAVQLITERIT